VRKKEIGKAGRGRNRGGSGGSSEEGRKIKEREGREDKSVRAGLRV